MKCTSLCLGYEVMKPLSAAIRNKILIFVNRMEINEREKAHDKFVEPNKNICIIDNIFILQ